MREVHDYVSDVIRRSQAAGGVFPERDASAEAWIFISIGLLGTVGRRVGGLLEEDFEAIIASRRALDDRNLRARSRRPQPSAAGAGLSPAGG